MHYPEFNEATGMKDTQFSLGMLFSSSAILRKSIRQHTIVHQRSIRLRKNLKIKIKWICTEGCNLKCYEIQQQRSTSFQIKTLNSQYTCNSTWVQKQVNSVLIAYAYEDEIRLNLIWPVKAFHVRVVNDLKYHINQSMIYKAMKKAKDNIIGKHEKEFEKLYVYANQLKRKMPSSTVNLMTEALELGTDRRRFKRLYVCLGPLKEGFGDGCRPLLGFDGCHLRGPFGGILLTTVATCPNDGIHSVAWV